MRALSSLEHLAAMSELSYEPKLPGPLRPVDYARVTHGSALLPSNVCSIILYWSLKKRPAPWVCEDCTHDVQK